ncbi:MAG: SDR family oxidoreductase, partial [Dehalococcoidia bacterium]
MSASGSNVKGDWALILGASSGFGGACALKLAEVGLNIFGVHLDRRSTLANVEKIVEKIKAQGREAVFFNINAASAEKRAGVLDKIEERLGQEGRAATVKTLIHSLAFGTLKPYVAPSAEDSITQAQMEMTLDVMANSLVYWLQDLVHRGLMVEGGRVYAMTSAGSQRVVPSYGAVSAAKAALESHIRQLAMELAPRGITINAIRAGITDTPALRKIPGHEGLIEQATRNNP